MERILRDLSLLDKSLFFDSYFGQYRYLKVKKITLEYENSECQTRIVN